MADDATAKPVGRADRRSDLQGPGVVFCPNPKMPLWSNHPRVFIDVATTGVGKCPYCGTVYRLKAGEKVARALTRRASGADDPLARHRAAVDRRRGDVRAAAGARSQARGERLTRRGAALGRAGVPRDAAGRRGRSSCRSRTAGSTGRRGARIAPDLRGRFDAAYVLPNSIKSALMPWLARIPRRVGYHGEGRCAAAQPSACRIPPGGRRWSRSTARSAGAGARRGDAAPRLRFDARDARRGAARGRRRSAARYWAFAPGAEYGPAKCWPPAHYAELARSLHARDGLPVAAARLGQGSRAVRRDRRARRPAPAASSPARPRCSTRWR